MSHTIKSKRAIEKAVEEHLKLQTVLHGKGDHAIKWVLPTTTSEKTRTSSEKPKTTSKKSKTQIEKSITKK